MDLNLLLMNCVFPNFYTSKGNILIQILVNSSQKKIIISYPIIIDVNKKT